MNFSPYHELSTLQAPQLTQLLSSSRILIPTKSPKPYTSHLVRPFILLSLIIIKFIMLNLH